MSREYPSDWNSRRKAVYQRDNFTCQNCGRRGGPHGNYELHAHHIVPKSKGGTHRKSNLKTLCKQCHNAIHGNQPAPTRSGYNDSYDTDADIDWEELSEEFPITSFVASNFLITLGLAGFIGIFINSFMNIHISLFALFFTPLLFAGYGVYIYVQEDISSIDGLRSYIIDKEDYTSE